jgi:lysophospholipase L1-like esterase
MLSKIKFTELVIRPQKVWIKILALTNIISFAFLLIISLHYQVPQKILNKLSLKKLEKLEKLEYITRYTYIDFRQMAIHSLVNGNAGFEIVMLGDSITAGGDWSALLNRTDVANFGIGGDATSYLLYRLFDVYLSKPKKCFLMIGINDFAGNDTVENVFNNYISIIEDIRGHNIEIIIQSTLYLSETASGFSHIGNNWENINVQVTNLNKLLIKYCHVNGLTYLDLNEILSKNNVLEEENSTDGVHLNETGYKKWRDKLMMYL